MSTAAADTKAATEPPGAAFKRAAVKAFGGGVAGALAMVVQVLALMWMRTTINFQHSKGMGTLEAMQILYAQGGIGRFYRGVFAALLQGPLSRFGDTAANAGMIALLEGVALSPATKTLCSSTAAALFRILITPIDTLKTTLQVQGAEGMEILSKRIASQGITTLYTGALASSFATLIGHYPWFVTYNFLGHRVPKATRTPWKQLRSALIGLICSFNSDVISNSVRVVKTARQAAAEDISYYQTVAIILEADGLQGLFLRGLTTKLLSNGLQAMLFTVCWKYFEEMIAKRQTRKLEDKAA